MIKIIRDQIAIVPIENPDMIGSLYIPDIAKDRLNQGLVKYRGPETSWLKIGDYVLFSGYTGTLTHIEGEGKLIIMPERFVIAVLPEPKNVMVPGLFFRDRVNTQANTEELQQILSDVLGDIDPDLAKTLADKLVKHGVIAPQSNPFYTATYEQALEHVAYAFGDDKEWRNTMIVKTARPNDSDNDLMYEDSDKMPRS